MIRKASLSIPTPCHENWDKMLPADKDRFCGSCQKNIYDFTKLSDSEILDKINSGQNLCGRFLNSQLNRELAISKEKSQVWIAAATGILAFLILGTEKVFSQTKPETHLTDSEKTTPPGTPLPDKKNEHVISGTVSDSLSPIPGVNVVVKGTTRGTQTDIDGRFTIVAEIGETLEISFVGMKTITHKIQNNTPISVTMKESVVLLGEVIYSRKRNFFGRASVWFANLFRSGENKRPVKYCFH